MAIPADPPQHDRRPTPPTAKRTAERTAERTARTRARRSWPRRVRGAAGRRNPYRGQRRRGRTSALALLLLAAALVGVDLAYGQVDPPSPGPDLAGSRPGAVPGTAGARPGAAQAESRPADPVGSVGPAVSAEPAAIDGPAAGNRTPSYPAAGPGSFGYATGTGPVLGTAGTLRRYRVATEERVGQDAAAFALAVQTILGDGRGWTASRRLRLQRVPRAGPADFTIFLATPASSERMCAAGGLHTRRFTSCRLPGKVVINLARWLAAVPGYGAPLEVYRAYAVNHEVGHELGYGHEACPGRGLAPVMQQQTYGLRGCTANGWPYPHGRRYRGPALP